MSDSSQIESIKHLKLQDTTGSTMMLSTSPAGRVIVSVEEPGSGPASDYALSDEDSQEVSAFLNKSRILFAQHLAADLGYIAATGQVIRAIKMHRMLFGSDLLTAKAAIKEAAEEARLRYNVALPITKMNELRERNEQLEDVLRTTRLLVTKASANGFTDDEACGELFRNQGKITEAVPVRPQDRAATQKILEDSMK